MFPSKTSFDIKDFQTSQKFPVYMGLKYNLQSGYRMVMMMVVVVLMVLMVVVVVAAAAHFVRVAGSAWSSLCSCKKNCRISPSIL